MIEINNTTKTRIKTVKLIALLEKLLKVYKIKKREVSIAIVGDTRIRSLNNIYRKKDKVTDVLSFEGEGDYLGEIIICFNQIKRQAKKANRKVEDELIFILVHGFLHLVGMNDETEINRLKMIKKGNELIDKYA